MEKTWPQLPVDWDQIGSAEDGSEPDAEDGSEPDTEEDV
jgi:hypothetical protein